MSTAKRWKVFIEAEHPGQKNNKGRPVEKMFSYDVEAEEAEGAFGQGMARFELEQALEGWRPIARCVMER